MADAREGGRESFPAKPARTPGEIGSPEKAPDPLDRRLLRLAPEDNVAAATTTIQAGETVLIDGRPVCIGQTVPTGHKVAIRPIAAGEKVTKYGAPIGSATRDIQPGEYVHTHNVKSDYLPTFERGAGGYGLGGGEEEVRSEQ
jgi:altronate dehydratase small subunit